MDIKFAIRSSIFLIAGLLVILFPKQVDRFQRYVLDKLHIKYRKRKDLKHLLYTGIVFIVVAVALFVYSVSR